MVDEFPVNATGVDTQLQFRWIQDKTLGSPAWAIDDIVIDCFHLNSNDNCYKPIRFEEDTEYENKMW